MDAGALMERKYYDTNHKELKLGQTVLVRYGYLGKIIDCRVACGQTFFHLNYFRINTVHTQDSGWLPASLTIMTDEEAMLWMLEN